MIPNSKYKNRSGKAEKWLETIYDFGSSEEIIRKIALRYWEQAQAINYRHKEGRVLSGNHLLEWGKLAGIKQIVPLPVKGATTHITPCEDGFRLSIRVSNKKRNNYYKAVRLGLELNPVLRWEFAHEIGHTFFYDKSFNPPQRVYGFDMLGEEALCQQFAAELLLPYDRLIKPEQQLTVESLIALANVYGAPLRVVIRRVIQEIKIMRAIGVIISKNIVSTWSKRHLSQKPLPKGIEIFSPPQSAFVITDEHLRLDEVVFKVCSSGHYWNSNMCEELDSKKAFVEGIKLRKIAPCGACLFLFHEEKPIFAKKLLFDNE